MTTTVTPPVAAPAPTSVRAFLFDPGESLDEPLRAHGTAGPLLAPVRGRTPAADRAVEHELATVVDDFLGLDVLDLAAAGWRGHAGLRSAARRTRDLPGSEEVVALARHRITSAHRPYVDLYVDGAKIGTLEVVLNLALEVSGLVCVVRDAFLTGISAGDCVVDVGLAVQNTPIAERRGRRLDLPGAFALRRPYSLLTDEPPGSESPRPAPPRPQDAPTVPGYGTREGFGTR
ncbi:hypothetical protein [Streptomyces roseicoloratus]|uniref:hypothetical protein n=1 Tax=Streptomyces roseicoloratus TaxID=2508722 RepID=UPI0010099BDB|nr:hypothetical protein [Streptomyces roseicoloratus]